MASMAIWIETNQSKMGFPPDLVSETAKARQVSLGSACKYRNMDCRCLGVSCSRISVVPRGFRVLTNRIRPLPAAIETYVYICDTAFDWYPASGFGPGSTDSGPGGASG